MPHSEDRSWWTDVQHLRPEARAAAAAEGASPAEAASSASAGKRQIADDGGPARRNRLTEDGRPTPESRPAADRQEPARHAVPGTSEPPVRQPAAAPTERLTRSDAAGFAAAFDHDGDWGRPQARSMTIVLERTAPDLDADGFEGEGEAWLEQRRDARLPVRARTPRPEAPQDRAASGRRPDRLDALGHELTGSTARAPQQPTSIAVVPRAAAEPEVAPRAALPQAARTRRLTPRPQPTPVERLAQRPDRIAMWAVALGVLLILIAAFSGDAQAATTAPAAPRDAAHTVVVTAPAAPVAVATANR